MSDVILAMEQAEKEFNVHVHFVIRRDPIVRRASRVLLIMFARRYGVGDEFRTLSRQALSYPTSDGVSLSAALFYLVTGVYGALIEQASTETAKQAGLFLDASEA